MSPNLPVSELFYPSTSVWIYVKQFHENAFCDTEFWLQFSSVYFLPLQVMITKQYKQV